MAGAAAIPIATMAMADRQRLFDNLLFAFSFIVLSSLRPEARIRFVNGSLAARHATCGSLCLSSWNY
jgi:hypothetical protein